MDLAEIYSRIWDCLDRAVAGKNQPFKTMQAATIGLDGSPNVRTVVLRRVSEPQSEIIFHTDLRSPKIAELSREPRIALVGVDPVRNLQIRATGKAEIIRSGPERLEAWKSSPDHTLTVYRTALAPGTPIDSPDQAFGSGSAIAGEQKGFDNFCVVKVHIESLEWLEHSNNDHHERALYRREGECWSQSWIAP